MLSNRKVGIPPQFHFNKLLLSKTRNLSDLLFFEFFGHWLVAVNYVTETLDQDYFTEEEMIQYGLYLYHACSIPVEEAYGRDREQLLVVHECADE